MYLVNRPILHPIELHLWENRWGFGIAACFMNEKNKSMVSYVYMPKMCFLFHAGMSALVYVRLCVCMQPAYMPQYACSLDGERLVEDAVFCLSEHRFDCSNTPISAVPRWSNSFVTLLLAWWEQCFANSGGQHEADPRVFPLSRAHIKKCKFWPIRLN